MITGVCHTQHQRQAELTVVHVGLPRCLEARLMAKHHNVPCVWLTSVLIVACDWLLLLLLKVCLLQSLLGSGLAEQR